MLKRYLAPLVLASMVLAGCQAPPQGKFTAEQIAAMKSYGFNELNGDWSLGFLTPFCSAKMKRSCVLRAKNRSRPWQHVWLRPA
jgi:hypothetical protein